MVAPFDRVDALVPGGHQDAVVDFKDTFSSNGTNSAEKEERGLSVGGARELSGVCNLDTQTTDTDT